MVIERACAEKPGRRFGSLGELGHALEKLCDGRALRTGYEFSAWAAFEEGAGWLELGQPQPAIDLFLKALVHDRDLGVAREGWELARWVLEGRRAALHAGTPPERPPRGADLLPVVGRVPWDIAEARAVALEAARDFHGALAVYREVQSDARTNRALFTARARCHQQVGEDGEAIDYAQRALAIGGENPSALETLVAAMLRKQWHEEAMRNAERLVDLTPSSGRAHYLRGKALFANGRMYEARDAFERASALDPTLLEAQLLRREVERVTGNVRQSVGSQHAPTFEIPEQLAELRGILVSGNTGDAIAALRDERYADNADAQLLLARFLAFDNRPEEAVAVFDLLAASSHRTAALVGKGSALLDLGRPGDALSIFEQLPDDADAAEGAARALEALGRIDEAAASYRRFVALASSGSELRVRAAQLWLTSR
jgi:tetratricopeptide (TPR) repeat protein